MVKALKFGLSALCLGAMLCSCQAKSSAQKDKKKLEKAGYTSVTIETAEEYEKKEGALLPKGEGMEYYLYGSKRVEQELKGYISAWYFDSIEHASAFSDKYLVTLLSVVDIKEVELKPGSHNNVVFVATQDAIDAAGLKL